MRRPHHAPQFPGPGGKGAVADPQPRRRVRGVQGTASGDENSAARGPERLPKYSRKTGRTSHVLSGVGQQHSQGELVAPLWKDLDIAGKAISVGKQSMKGENSRLIVTRSKAENSIRLIPIPQEAMGFLIKGRAKHPDSPCLFASSRIEPCATWTRWPYSTSAS